MSLLDGGFAPLKFWVIVVLMHVINMFSDLNFEFGDSAEYLCIRGHYLPDGSGRFSIPCLANGTFAKPDVECAPVECPLGEVLNHGRLQNADNRALYQDSATLVCDEGYAKWKYFVLVIKVF